MTKNKKDNAIILMGAFDKAGSELKLSTSEKSKILGIHPSTFVRNINKGYSPQSKTGELQLLFIQLYKALYQMTSGDKVLMQHWFCCDNKALNGSPKILCRSTDGLIRTMQYLKPFRP